MTGRLYLINLKALLSGIIRRGSRKSSGGKKVFTAIIVIILVFSLFTMFFGFFAAMCAPYFSTGLGWLYFAMLAFTVFMLCVISTIFSVSSMVFHAKDNELLLSMPIKPSAILTARLLVILSMEYAFAIIAGVAALIPWISGGFATALGAVFFVVGLTLLPLFSLTLSMLLAWILGLILSKIRRKNVVTLVLSLGFLAAYFYAYANLQKYMVTLLTRGADMAEAFRSAMPPFYAFGMSIAERSFGNLILFLLWSAVPFSLIMWLLSVNYLKVLTANKGTAKIVYKERAHKQTGAFATLLRKELMQYLSRPSVILNTSIASLLLIAGAVGLLIKGDALLSSLIGPLAAMPALLDVGLPVLCAIVLVFIGSMNNLSSSLISLEGRKLWVVKSIPVSAKTVFTAKLAMHCLISALPCLFASVSAAFVLGGSVPDRLLLLILPQTFVLLTAVGGLVINLKFPNFDWVNETAVVKQGASAMLTMFGGMGLVVVLFIVYIFALRNVMGLKAYLWGCAGLAFLASIVMVQWLSGRGAKVFGDL